jgi:serine/threonine protein kinase
MTKPDRCSRCGAVLPTDAPEGSLCPRCLLKIGLGPTGTGPEAVSPTTRDTPSDQDPEVIGPYKILDKLGEGGMGVVYVAEQTEPVRRKVALKLIKLGMDSRQVIARFESERQALALMNHPNVAKVFDAGVTDRGRPYFVMEYVPGIAITEYCDLRCLSLRERLELFIQICDAIRHAHQKGIIHRDVKPSNVLVATEDGKPSLKVIDFGVAKATSQRLTERTLYTQQGILIGTPEYMSPEQARTTALDVDTRTDIYSLGMVLYELLVGALPFDPQTLRRAATVEMLRVIREDDPPKPTTKFGSLGDAAGEIAKRRHADVPSLARQLRGELEWITMRALEKDPARRYASVSEFSADVRRHLDDEPVAAGPPSRVYRLKKLVRKNRALFTGAATILGFLVAAVAVSTTMYYRSEVARRLAANEAARNALEVRALQAALWETDRYRARSGEALEMHRKVLGSDNAELAPYLVSRLWLLDYMDNLQLEERQMLAHEAVALVDRFLDARDPDAFMSVGLLTDVVEPNDALPLVRKALALMRQELPHADDGIVEDMRVLVRYITHGWFQLLDTEDQDWVEVVYREALARRQRSLPPGAPGLKEILQDLGIVVERKASRLLRAGDLSAAEPAYREALRLLGEAGFEGTRSMAEVESDLGACLTLLGRFEEAERLLVNAHDFLGREVGRESSAAQEALGRIVDLYEKWGRPGETARFRARLPEIAIGQVSDLGPIPLDLGLGYPGGGHSALLDGRSVWVFWSDAAMRPDGDGTHLGYASLAWTDDLDASDGLWDFHVPEKRAGIPRMFIPLTPEETATTAALADPDCREPCQVGWFLRSGPIVADPERDRSIVFYMPFLRHRGDERAGASLAVCSRAADECVRPVVQPGTENPTLLFEADEPAWGSAALVAGDQMYAYACECPEIECSCLLARVPLGDALDRSAWRFFTAEGRWSSEWREAGPVLEGPIRDGVLSVHWNAYLGKYLATSSKTLDARVDIRVADRPEGPWSDPVVRVDTVFSKPGWFWTFSGLCHPEFSREGGRIEYLTFVRNAGWLGSEMHLIELRFR